VPTGSLLWRAAVTVVASVSVCWTRNPFYWNQVQKDWWEMQSGLYHGINEGNSTRAYIVSVVRKVPARTTIIRLFRGTLHSPPTIHAETAALSAELNYICSACITNPNCSSYQIVISVTNDRTYTGAHAQQIMLTNLAMYRKGKYSSRKRLSVRIRFADHA
jgi:hypothetical protein